MYEISYGSKCQATKGLSRVEVAKLIRGDIKAAVKAGTLPQATYSVRCHGSSIHVSLSALPFAVLSRDFYRLSPDASNVPEGKHWSWKVQEDHFRPACHRYTPEALAARDAVTAIVEAYNFDGSEVQSDYFNVRFYKSIDLAEDGESLIADLTAKAAQEATAAEARLASVAAPASYTAANDTKATKATKATPSAYTPVGCVAAVGWED
jgi:hypothetical protein